MKKKNGFTLVELLAVIVILAIILVIAVPQVLGSIETAREGSIISSVKMMAATAETKYQEALVNGTSFPEGEAQDCIGWGGLNSTDYDTCSATVSDGVATVKITGKEGGKFSKWSTKGCSGTRVDVTCTPNS